MESIPAEALNFIRELRKNNNRPWFNERKADFKTLETSMKSFFSEVADLLQAHDDIGDWRPYRIYRDVHFSKDKTPYKRYFAAEYNRRKPALRGGYYIRIAPDNESFLEVGFWGPNKDDLKRMRTEWESYGEEFLNVLSDRRINKNWGNITGDKLKTAPSGFDRNHPYIDLINLKQWIFHHPFTDQEVLSKNFSKKVDGLYRDIRPFLDYMSDVLTTDLNGESLIR